MFSIESFYYILDTNLFKPLNINGKYFYPFGSTDYKNLLLMEEPGTRVMHNCVFYDQEPIFNKIVDNLIISGHLLSRKKNNILANSEYSEAKKLIF